MRHRIERHFVAAVVRRTMVSLGDWWRFPASYDGVPGSAIATLDRIAAPVVRNPMP